ncbi:MAG TPA: flagellar basal body-associated FliL family protein [Acidimicrobiia bacterium]|jgi:flagellar FliL protein
MAKDGADTETETPDEPEKKSKKKLISIIAVVLIALVAAKMTVLKPKPLTPAEVAAQAKAVQVTLHDTCAAANGLKLIDSKVAPPTTEALDTSKVLAPNDDSVTIDLADGAYLKVGIALELAAGIDPTVAKTDGLGDKATDITLRELAKHTMAGLAPPGARNKVQQQLSFDVCMAYNAKILSVYFTEFVMQAS